MRIWESRCYSDGIPDEVPARLSETGRVPNYKAIAMCILKNDLHLRALGFGRHESELVEQIYQMRREQESKQLKLL